MQISKIGMVRCSLKLGGYLSICKRKRKALVGLPLQKFNAEEIPRQIVIY